jgi:hypothetical protein
MPSPAGGSRLLSLDTIVASGGTSSAEQPSHITLRLILSHFTNSPLTSVLPKRISTPPLIALISRCRHDYCLVDLSYNPVPARTNATFCKKVTGKSGECDDL